MTSEYLLDAIGKIKSETVEKNAIIEKNVKQEKNAIIEINAKQGKNARFEKNAIIENSAIGAQDKRNKAVNWARWAAVAAALVLMTGAGLLILRQHGILGGNGSQGDGSGNMADSGNVADSDQNRTEVTGSMPASSGQDGASANGSGNDKEIAIDQKPEKYVEIASLFPVRNSNISVELALEVAKIQVGAYTAGYERKAHADGVLADSLGMELADNAGWYKVSGHEEQQYLIHKENEEYSLWKFAWIESEEYPYDVVLRTIYGIESADDFDKIKVTATKIDNTEEGRRIQQEIGEYEIKDSEDLRRIYEILSRMTCYGENNWDKIEYTSNNIGFTQAVSLGRQLTIELENGSSIDSLIYTAVGGMFYEFYGVAYNKLSTEESEAVERILKIQRLDALNSGQSKAGIIASDDAPVDEGTYQEAHRYSDEIEGIQAAISEAMCRGDLPFVISSGIYENPVRIVVRVNTHDQKLIDQVKAFDTAGGVIEIEFSEKKAVLE